MEKAKEKDLTPEELLREALITEEEQPYEVPENWVWTRLGKLASVTTGKEDANFASEDGKYVFFTCAENPAMCNVSAFSGESILISGNGMFHVNYYDGEFNAYQRTYVLQSFRGVIGKYVYYHTLLAIESITKNNRGSTIRYIRMGDVTESGIPLPPFAEQQRIVERIESLFAKLDQATELAQNALDTFEARKSAILHKAFTGELTTKWREHNGMPLAEWGDISFEAIMESGPQNGLYKPKSEYGEGYGIVRIDSFYDGLISPWNSLKRLSLSEDELHLYQLHDSDILINRVNSMQYLGKSALVRALDGNRVVFESNVMRLAVNRALVEPEYIIRYLNSPQGLMELRKNAKQAVNQASINQQDVRAVSIPLPHISEQKEIVRIIDSLFKREQQTLELVCVIDRIVLLKKVILARAFRSKLGTNDPAEESAIELLKESLG